MPKGVYIRTQEHIEICSRAGKAKAAKHPRTEVDFKCQQCGENGKYLKGNSRRFCSVSCKNKSFIREPKTYGAIHRWVRRNFGTPSECENCGTLDSKKFEWANLDGKYRLDRSTWMRLCCQCHRRYDRGIKNKIYL